MLILRSAFTLVAMNLLSEWEILPLPPSYVELTYFVKGA